jgi:alpha-amylase
MLAEALDEGPFTNFLPLYQSGFDSVFNFPMRRAFIDAFAKGGSMDAVARSMDSAIKTLGLARARTMVTLLDNHDVPRFLTEAGGGISDAELSVRHALALTALFTLPGIPQLYYGDELGMTGVFPENRRDMPAWAWDAQTRAGARPGYAGDPKVTFEFVSKLTNLRKTNEALQRGSYAELWRQNAQPTSVFAFHRALGNSRIAVVMHNSAGSSGNVEMSFATNPGIAAADKAAWPDGTVLEDLLDRGAPRTITVTGGKLPVKLDGKVAGIYRARP